MLSKQVAVGCAGAFGSTILMTWLKIRAYGILCTIALLFWLYKTRYPNTIVLMPEKITTKFNSIYNSFVKLRNDKPGAFCTIVSLILVILAIFGHIVSGQWIVLFGLIVAGLISTKHQIRIVKDTSDDKSWGSQTTDHDNDEFLPEVNESTLYVLQRAGESALLSQKSSTNTDNILCYDDDDDDDTRSDQEIPSDLIIPENSLPEIDENSLSSLSDAEEDQNLHLEEIKFNSKHFNRDTSSSDDDSITRGLSFQDLSMNVIDGSSKLEKSKSMSKSYQQQGTTTETTGKNKKGGGTTINNLTPSDSSNLMNLVQWGVNNIVQSAVQQHITQQINSIINPPATTSSSVSSSNNSNLELYSSDDEDYEFINPDDLNS